MYATLVFKIGFPVVALVLSLVYFKQVLMPCVFGPVLENFGVINNALGLVAK